MALKDASFVCIFHFLERCKQMSLMERLRQCAEIAGSGDEMARKAAIPRRTWEYYVTGESTPNAVRLEAVVRATGVNGHWLLTGEGPMLPADAQPSAVAPTAGNISIYADAMEVIDLFLKKTNRTLDPAKKRQAVDALYHLSIDKGGKIDPKVAEMIMQLAA